MKHGGWFNWHCWHYFGKQYEATTHNGLSRKYMIQEKCCECTDTREVTWDPM